MRKVRIGYFLFIPLAALSISCSQPDNPASYAPEPVKSGVSGYQAGNFAPGELEAHYLKHGYQFGNITQDEYLANAQSLLNTGPGGNILEKIRPNGDILHYKESTGEFAAMTKEGRIRTYFKADFVLELPAGTIASSSTAQGDTLSLA